jgi:hypothetical protein
MQREKEADLHDSSVTRLFLLKFILHCIPKNTVLLIVLSVDTLLILLYYSFQLESPHLLCV